MGNDDIFAGTGNQLCTLQSTAGRFGKLAFENFIFGGSKCGHRTDTGSLDAGKGAISDWPETDGFCMGVLYYVRNLFIYAKVDPGAALFNIVLQFYCITLLYLQSALFKKSSMRKELETIQLLWHQQKGQYQLSKETIELINHKCHDLKHQVQAIRAVKDEKERETYLEKIEKSVQIYSAIVRTGNEILDTILTEKSLICENSGIHINCVADGSLLAFMNPVDLYTLFGNALDNAIEAVRKLESKEKRVIDIMLYERQSFLMLQIVNPMCGEVKFEDGLPLTTKAKNGYHGYGMKSMLHTIQKYEGHLTTEVKNGCFYFNVMLPLERDSNKK